MSNLPVLVLVLSSWLQHWLSTRVVFVTAVQAPIVSRLMRFFGGAAAAAGFDVARASDAALERRVESRVPYVDALRLSGDRFVLADVELNDVGAFDVRANVRHSKTHTPV